MKKLFAIISLFALVLTSCEKEETIVIGSNFDTITATIESAADTKATLHTSGTGTGQGVPVIWKGDDKISVFILDGGIYKNVLYILNSGQNTTEGTFQKATNEPLGDNATIVAAVYPYNANAIYTNGTINVPATEIKGQSNAYIINAGPMAAKANGTSNSLEFKNVGAYVRVGVKDIPTGYTSVELSSETSNLSGAYSLEFDINGIPTATLIGNNKTITHSDNSGFGSETIYFPVFAGTYSDLKVTAKGTAKPDITLIAPKALNAVRNTIHYTTANIVVANNNTEFINAVNGSSNTITVIVGGSITEMELPESSGKTITLVIQNTDSDITVKAQDTKVVSSKINLVFAERTTVTDKTLTIILPDATVEASGNATFANINSTTASNTLILGAGIKATNVTVNKGNVQVNENAELNGITLGTGVETVTVINNGGTIAQDVIDNSNVTTLEKSEYDLKQAIAKGETYTLKDDITITETIEINTNATVVLNGNKLTANVNKARAFKITGNNVKFTLDATNSNVEFGNGTYGIIELAADVINAEVLVEGGTFTGTTDYGALIRYRPGNKNNKVTLDGVTYTDNCEFTSGMTNAWVVSAAGLFDTDTDNKLSVKGGSYTASCGFGMSKVTSEFDGMTLNTKGSATELWNSTVKNCNITLDPGLYTGTADAACIGVANNGEVTVTGSTLTVASGSDGKALFIMGTGGSISVDANTTISGDVNDTYGDISIQYNVSTTVDLKQALAAHGTPIITLSEDIELTETIQISTNATVVLNGNKLTANVNKARAFKITGNNVKFTLDATNSNVEFGNGTYGIIELAADVINAEVLVEGGTFTGTTDYGALIRYRPGNKNNKVTLDGVTYTDNCEFTSGMTNAWVVSAAGLFDTDTDNKLSVKGGSYTASCGFGMSKVTSEFDGMTLNTKGSATELWNSTVKNCNITLDPGLYTGTADAACIGVANSGVVTVTGSTLTVASGSNGKALFIMSTGGSISYDSQTTINGTVDGTYGTITGPVQTE